MNEDWFKVVRVNCSVASIPPFRVDILLFSESVQFDTKMTRMKSNNKIELREVFRLPYLPLGQYLGSRKVPKVFMICNNIDGIGQTS